MGELYLIKDDPEAGVEAKGGTRPYIRNGLPGTVVVHSDQHDDKGYVMLTPEWMAYVRKINNTLTNKKYMFDDWDGPCNDLKEAVGWHNEGKGNRVEQLAFSGNPVKVKSIEGNRAYIECFYLDQDPPEEVYLPTKSNLHHIVHCLSTQFYNRLDIATNNRYPRTFLIAKPGERLWIDIRDIKPIIESEVVMPEPKCPVCGTTMTCPKCSEKPPVVPPVIPPSIPGVLPHLGKGCYIWRPQNIFNGDVQSIVNMMKAAKVQHVCIKGSDGYYTYPDILPLANGLRAAGIRVGVWGYVYLKWIPKTEAEALALAAKTINADYMLLDIEDAASFFQWTNATVFINRLRELLPNMPTAMNSFWKPSWHTEIPYSKIRPRCNFDAPQIYSRGTDPVKKYDESKIEYSRLNPVLPFSLPAGDMYFEGGVKPRPGDVTKFMRRAREDVDAKGCVMWAADQRETTPELWAEFAAYDWEADLTTPIPPVTPPDYEALYAAVVTADYLYIRTRPDSTGSIVGHKIKGDRVTVYMVSGSWSCIDAVNDYWVGSKWLKRM